MATKKTAIRFEDRDLLIDLLRPLADAAGDRSNLTRLAGKALEQIEAHVAASDDPDLADWLERTQRHAFADRLYTELDLLLKAQRIKVVLPFTRKPVILNPRQGVRLPGMKEYQQIAFLAFTWDEYDSWRADQIGRFERAAEMRAIIDLIDKARMLHSDLPGPGAALHAGGAKIEVVTEANAAA